MADEREGADGPRQSPASEDKVQSAGRAANAAQPLNAAKDRGGPERYPEVDQTDAVQGARRCPDPAADAPQPRQSAGGKPDPAAAAAAGRLLGPGGDPAEGKPA